MNLKFLGDPLDHWKGSIFCRLQEVNLLNHFMVDAMATDSSQWRDSDRVLYSNLLCVKPTQLIQHHYSLSTSRDQYFKEVLQYTGDLFLDPDTGIGTNNQRPRPEHLTASELHLVLNQSPSRVVLVYQHVRGIKTNKRVKKVIDWLRKPENEPFCWYSYESPSVAMLFLSRQAKRLNPIGAFLREMLGRHAHRRIRPRKPCENVGKNSRD